MTIFDSHAYTITIKRVTEDGERLFYGSVRELPDLATYEATYKRAYDLLIEAIESLHKGAETAGRPFPPPAEFQGEFSGRVTLRMPPSLHRKVAWLAEYEGTSLNTYVIAVLAERVGESAGTTGTIGTIAVGADPQALGQHRTAQFYGGLSLFTHANFVTGHPTIVGSIIDFAQNVASVSGVSGIDLGTRSLAPVATIAVASTARELPGHTFGGKPAGDVGKQRRASRG